MMTGVWRALLWNIQFTVIILHDSLDVLWVITEWLPSVNHDFIHWWLASKDVYNGSIQDSRRHWYPSNKIKHERISHTLYFCMFTVPIYRFERTVKEIYSQIEYCMSLWVLWWWLLSSFWWYGFGCKLCWRKMTSLLCLPNEYDDCTVSALFL